ncbi:hypothetical protein CTAYLR_010539, partial [Chrysophaeum taylorii]
MLVEMDPIALLNGIDDDLEMKRCALVEMVEAEEEWVYSFLDLVSEAALESIAQKRITTQTQIVEVSRLFDKVGVDPQRHARELLNMMTCSHAAGSGHLQVLMWAREAGCRWDGWTCSHAAGSGHLQVLMWARENGCPWDARTCSSAARGGHLDILTWARKAGCPWDARTCAEAAGSGHLQVLMWARENGCPWDK